MKTEILSKIAENDNIIKILTAKHKKSFNEIENHIENTLLTRSQLLEIREALNTIKSENELMLSDNKIIRDEIAAQLLTSK